MKPEVVKIFDDLEALHDFCRFELLPFNQADLYNRQSKVWQQFEATRRGNNGRRYNKDRVEFRPRGQYNGNRSR